MRIWPFDFYHDEEKETNKSLRGEDGSLRWTLIMRFDCLNTFHEITGKTPSVESTNIPDPYLESRNAQGLFPT